MKTATVKVRGIAPYSQSKPVLVPKLDKESHRDYEARTWKERLHADKKGDVFIPPMAWKNALSEAAKYLSIKIPGKGKSTYTKHFEAGIMITEPSYLGVNKEDVEGEWLFVPSDGRRGGGSRVEKCFPVIHAPWNATVKVYVTDETITEEVFEYHFGEMGKFIGLGRFRPRNNGFYGRFVVESVTWE